MKKIALALGIALLGGCHGLTPQETTETRDNAAAGKRLLDRWDKTSDTSKKAFVFAFTRTAYNILYTTQGEQPPAEFAPVTSASSGQ